jgi:hypothetical protein
MQCSYKSPAAGYVVRQWQVQYIASCPFPVGPMPPADNNEDPPHVGGLGFGGNGQGQGQGG